MEQMRVALPQNIRGLKRVEYDALVETGALEGVPVELLDGQLVQKVSPAGAAHSGLTVRLADALYPMLRRNMTIRMNMPFAASEDSEPEPDLAVVPRGGLEAHPARAYLIVEVCQSSAHNDRVVKPRIYAAAGVPEYWILDVRKRAVEIYTQPRLAAYAKRRVVTDGVIRPAALPRARVDVAALFRP